MLTAPSRTLRTAVRLKPNLASGHLVLGQALSAKGSLDEAIVQLREAAKLAPKDADPHRALARALSAQHKTPEALVRDEGSRGACSAAPGSARRVGLTPGARAARRAEAEQQFQAALQIDPRYQPAHFHLGVMLLNRGDVAGAAEGIDHGNRTESQRRPRVFLPGQTHTRLPATRMRLFKPTNRPPS